MVPPEICIKILPEITQFYLLINILGEHILITKCRIFALQVLEK